MVNEKTKHPVIIIDLPEPVSGFWDGFVKKSHFEFKPDQNANKPSGKIRWGSYEANFWFMAGAGKSWMDAVSIAKRSLVSMLKVKGAKITIEWRS